MSTLNNFLDEISAVQCPPQTKRKLMDAAIRCAKNKGIDKTSLNDIAKEAGCARQTVYNYYKNSDAVVLAALIEASESFAQRLVAHVAGVSGTGEQILEAIMYCLEEMPKEPYLQVIADSQFSPVTNQDVFNSRICLGIIDGCAKILLRETPALQAESEEIGETMTRIVISLLTINGPKYRDSSELRAYIRRRFLPGLLGGLG